MVNGYVNVIVSGHDTTTAAMSFVLQLLASNSAVMRRLQKEVDEKFDSINFSPDNWEAIKVSMFVRRTYFCLQKFVSLQSLEKSC